MSQISSANPKNPFTEPISWLYSFWKFARPHTIVGTSLSVIALYAIAIATTSNSITTENFVQFLGVWIACLCGNVYIVGLNQVEDVEIDKINKPHLPIAAGEFSIQTGRWIVAITGILALILSGWLGIWLLAVVGLSLAIGSAYSFPPIRLKRFPFLAASCIFIVRGVVVNLGIFLHFGQKLQGREFLPLVVWVLTAFIVVFTVAIAIFKDVPDLEGDKKFNISTFSIIIGKQAVFNLARWLITICYLGTVLVGIFGLDGVNSLFLVVSHLSLLGLFWWRSFRVNLEEKKSIAQFYQFIWKLFFLEYLMFPIACLLV
ncbi:MAG: homogentisate phytyltransferase [Prochloraceae cyanobacterium]|nr:homogentisate phytyltransferase [Prochloraceae cyanobacterium]